MKKRLCRIGSGWSLGGIYWRRDSSDEIHHGSKSDIQLSNPNGLRNDFIQSLLLISEIHFQRIQRHLPNIQHLPVFSTFRIISFELECWWRRFRFGEIYSSEITRSSWIKQAFGCDENNRNNFFDNFLFNFHIDIYFQFLSQKSHFIRFWFTFILINYFHILRVHHESLFLAISLSFSLMHVFCIWFWINEQQK